MPPRRAETPARVTRSTSRAPGPLPAVDTRRSHAYGARGKASLNAQVTTSHAAIDQAFAQTREEPELSPEPEPEAEPEAEASPEPAAPAPAPAPKPVKPAPRHQSPRSSRSRHSQAPADGVAGAIPAGMRPSTALDLTMYQRVKLAAELAGPSKIELFVAACSRFLCTWQFWFWLGISWITCFAYVSLFGTLFSVAPLPTEELEVSRDTFFYHIGRAFGHESHLIPRSDVDELRATMVLYWHHMRITKDKFQEQNVTMQSLNVTTNELAGQVGLLSDSVAEIKSILPKTVIAEEKDGRFTIPAPFWEALLEKFTSSEATPIWDAFMEWNQAKIQEVVDGAVASEMERGAQYGLVTRDSFQEMIADNNHFVEQNMNETLNTFQTMMLQEAKGVAREVAQDIFERSSDLAKGQVKALAYSNVIANMDKRMRETNYFSAGLGALILPRYTSPTWRLPSTFQYYGQLAWKAIGMATKTEQAHLTVNPPTSALTEWSENGDCWCADSPRAADVKLQIAVHTPFKVYPRYLIIEHIPAPGTRDIASAPKDFEMWIKMESKEEADRLKQDIKDRKERFWPDLCGEPPRSTASGGDIDDDTWLCAGSSKYDIHHHNYLQSFPFPHNPWNIGLETWSVVLKVTSNWGADHTCLYRIRLTGDEVENFQ